MGASYPSYPHQLQSASLPVGRDGTGGGEIRSASGSQHPRAELWQLSEHASSQPGPVAPEGIMADLLRTRGLYAVPEKCPRPFR